MSLREAVTMAVEKHRFPLGEFSSSSINKKGPVSNKTYRKTSTNLPSIKSLIHCTPSFEIPSIKIHATGAEIHGNGYVNTTTNLIPHPRDFNDAAHKLRIRLQLAYYKFKTNQTNIKFRELKRKAQHRCQSQQPDPVKKAKEGRLHTKRRKLLVSQGNYRTPAKSTSFTKNDFVQCLQKDSDTSANNFLQFTNGDMSKSINTTTPIGKSQHYLQSVKQDTPMSVKAAKSLIHLFTSNQN